MWYSANEIGREIRGKKCKEHKIGFVMLLSVCMGGVEIEIYANDNIFRCEYFKHFIKIKYWMAVSAHSNWRWHKSVEINRSLRLLFVMHCHKFFTSVFNKLLCDINRQCYWCLTLRCLQDFVQCDLLRNSIESSDNRFNCYGNLTILVWNDSGNELCTICAASWEMKTTPANLHSTISIGIQFSSILPIQNSMQKIENMQMSCHSWRNCANIFLSN